MDFFMDLFYNICHNRLYESNNEVLTLLQELGSVLIILWLLEL